MLGFGELDLGGGMGGGHGMRGVCGLGRSGGVTKCGKKSEWMIMRQYAIAGK